MADTVDSSERTVEHAIEEATEGWQPDDGREFDPHDYTWAFLPCPSCGEAHLTGVHDPDEQLGDTDRMFVVIPGGDDGR